MPWAKFDERFPSHHKVRRLSADAFRLHVSAICWSSEHLTNGHIPTRDVAFVSDVKRVAKATAECVEAGVWELAEDGWQIHDYLVYNPTREQVLADREQAKERQRKAREAAKARRDAAEALAKSQEASRRDSAVTTPDVQSPRPDPTRPDPKVLSEPSKSSVPSEPPRGTELTQTQRSKKITDAYAERVPLSNWTAVNALVLRGIRSNRYADDELRAALFRLADENRPVTADSLRVAIEGMGRSSPNRNQPYRNPSDQSVYDEPLEAS